MESRRMVVCIVPKGASPLKPSVHIVISRRKHGDVVVEVAQKDTAACWWRAEVEQRMEELLYPSNILYIHSLLANLIQLYEHDRVSFSVFLMNRSLIRIDELF